MISTSGRGSVIAAGVFLALVLGFPPALAEDSGVKGNSRIVGKITGPDGKSPVRDASVVAYHLSTETFHHSGVTNDKGEYLIPDLPAGYYDLAVKTPQGLFVGSTIVNVAPARKTIADFSVVPYEDGAGVDARAGERAFPGSEAPPSGSAKVDEKLTQREFWRSAKGVAILASGGTAILLAIVSSGDERAVSAF